MDDYDPSIACNICEGVAENRSRRVQGLSKIPRSLGIRNTREEDEGSGGSFECGGDLGVGVVIAGFWAASAFRSRWRSFVALHELLGFQRGYSKWRCGNLKNDAEAEDKQGEESGLRKSMIGCHTEDVVLL